MTSSMEPGILSPLLRTKEFGRRYHYYQEASSTNAVARSLGDGGGPQGTLVVAETQREGRGRLNRSWASPPGGIWLSLLLRPALLPHLAPLQTFLAAVSLVESLRQEQGLHCAIKWPNDIQFEGKKVAGILTELKTKDDVIDYLIVGMGINANFPLKALPFQLRAHAATLLDLLHRPIDRSGFTARLLETWEDHYRNAILDGYEDTRERWRLYTNTLGRDVDLWTGEGEMRGRALDIDDRGGLVIRLPSGERKTIMAGEILPAREKE